MAAAALSWALPPLLGAASVSGGELSWFPTSDGELAFQRFGGGSRTLVLLSGGPGIDPSILLPVAEDLAADNTVVLLHQRGTGASWNAPLDPAALTVAGFVADVDALRVALALPALHLVGQSWGSMLAMAYAAAHRDRVASLTLLNPGGPNLDFMRDFTRRVEAKLTPEQRAVLRTTPATDPEHLKIELHGDVHDPANVAPLVATLGPRSANQRVFRGLMHDATRHYDVRAALAGFEAPTLLLFGDDDPSLAAKEQLVALFPGAQLIVLPEAGHLGWLDRPAAYREAVLSWIAMLPPYATAAAARRAPRTSRPGSAPVG